jgi:hypothetical protein
MWRLHWLRSASAAGAGDHAGASARAGRIRHCAAADRGDGFGHGADAGRAGHAPPSNASAHRCWRCSAPPRPACSPAVVPRGRRLVAVRWRHPASAAGRHPGRRAAAGCADRAGRYRQPVRWTGVVFRLRGRMPTCWRSPASVRRWAISPSPAGDPGVQDGVVFQLDGGDALGVHRIAALAVAPGWTSTRFSMRCAARSIRCSCRVRCAWSTRCRATRPASCPGALLALLRTCASASSAGLR